MNRKHFLVLLLLLLTGSPAWAEPTIVLEDPKHPGSHTYDLLQNTPNQKIQVYVSGGSLDQVAGVDFNMELGGGGPALGQPAAPVFTGVDLTTGTIFQNSTLESVDSGSLPDVLTWWILEGSGTVEANGLLATLTIDTTGYYANAPVHSWSLDMENTANGPSVFLNNGEVPALITDGTITLVAPEPSSLALFGTAATALAGLAARKRLWR
jgi:hypothetical protein